MDALAVGGHKILFSLDSCTRTTESCIHYSAYDLQRLTLGKIVIDV